LLAGAADCWSEYVAIELRSHVVDDLSVEKLVSLPFSTENVPLAPPSGSLFASRRALALSKPAELPGRHDFGNREDQSSHRLCEDPEVLVRGRESMRVSVSLGSLYAPLELVVGFALSSVRGHPEAGGPQPHRSRPPGAAEGLAVSRGKEPRCVLDLI